VANRTKITPVRRWIQTGKDYTAIGHDGHICGLLMTLETNQRRTEGIKQTEGGYLVRKFKDGYQEVQVWSRTEKEHQAALEQYIKSGWDLATPKPVVVYRSETPYRSVVTRKLRG
jgi:hypothetical protein